MNSSTRRQFAKHFLMLSACSTFLPRHSARTLLAEVKPPKRPTLGLMRLRISDFPDLRNDFGSVRIGTSEMAGNNPAGLFYPILINRGAGGQFFALNSECTHAGCVVRPYDRSAGSCPCPCHGSRYAIDGQRISGPAFFPLLRYTAHFDGVDVLSVELPDFPHEIDVLLADPVSAARPRLQLRFLAFSRLQYEVVFRTSLNEDWRTVPFSTTPAGPLDQTEVDGGDDFLNLYVDASLGSGFFGVAMQIQRV